MYKYTVPMTNSLFAKDDREAICELLKKMGVYRVLLPVGSYQFNDAVFEEELSILKDNCGFLKEHGFEVGTWLWTFMDVRGNSDFIRMVLPSGKVSGQSVCPSDESFRKFAANYICRLAECGVDLILYDDDFRYGNLAGEMGCLCKNHLAYMENILGEKLSVDMLRDSLVSGGANKYRSAWQASKRYYFELFAREMREALDRVRPEVRLGVCSCYPNWDHDGITTYEICKLLAGKTQPFLRLTGAPFWALPNHQLANHRLQDTIETARMALSFCGHDSGAEIVGEGDTYPRPRFMGPANHLEGYDQVLRAEGIADGIIKYTFDYSSTYTYETGYNRRHLANMPLYEKIDAMFGGKKPLGIRVFEHLNKYENMDIPDYINNQRDLQHTFFSWAARMLAAAQIPTVYDGEGVVSIAFGENAKYLTEKELKCGVILDARAAEILTERGIDVGLVSRGKRVGINAEHFVKTGQTVGLMSSAAYRLTLREGAEIESTFVSTDGMTEMESSWAKGGASKDIVASYFYENRDGGKFLVYSFDGTLAHNTIFRHYERADQLKAALTRLGKSIGFTVSTSPDLYTLAKEGDGKIAVGLWNFSADPVDEPFIKIEGGKSARVISTINCDAAADGDRISLSPIAPFGFAAVEFEII